MYLMAVMHWWSRHLLAWRLGNTSEAEFCVSARQAALTAGRRNPLMANTDHAAQFTSPAGIAGVEAVDVRLSIG